MPLPTPRPSMTRSSLHCLACLLASLTMSGCTVLAVADMTASAVVGVGGLAVDAAVGTAKIGGKIIGKTADVVLGSDDVTAQ